MLKRIVRSAIATGCRAAGLMAQAERGTQSDLTVLCYHRVLPAERRADYFLPHLAVTPDSFAHQCEYLARHFDVLTLSDAVARWSNGESGERPAAVLTFDDGYGDNLAYAAPILSSAGIPATFFVIAGLVGARRAPWYDRLGQAVNTLIRDERIADVLTRCAFSPDGERGGHAHGIVEACKRVGPDRRKEIVEFVCGEVDEDDAGDACDVIMDREGLRRLAESGHEIGSHSNTHEILPSLDDDALRREVFESKGTLEDATGRPVKAFCFPNGDYDDRTLHLIRDAGYTSAVTVHAGTNAVGGDPFLLRRRFVDEERLRGARGHFSEALFRMELSGLADRLFRRNTRMNTST